jgi:transposase
MRFYTRQHRHYCGIDLHVKTMYVCILDAAGQVLVHRNVPSTPEAFLEIASVRKSIDVDLALLERYDDLITDLELTIVREAKRHDADAFHRLRSVPGIGKVLAWTMLYEIHDITRFDRVQEFASYARRVKCTHQSAGKTYGTGGAKRGNVHLTWAFSEAAVLYLRHAPGGKKLLAEIEKETRERQSPFHSRSQDRACGVLPVVARHGVLHGEVSRGIAEKRAGEPDG